MTLTIRKDYEDQSVNIEVYYLKRPIDCINLTVELEHVRQLLSEPIVNKNRQDRSFEFKVEKDVRCQSYHITASGLNRLKYLEQVIQEVEAIRKYMMEKDLQD